MSLTAVDLDEMIKVAADRKELTEDLLRLEQLPQVALYYGLKLSYQKLAIIGPDGTVLGDESGRKIESPLIDDPVGWEFPRVDFAGLEGLVGDTVGCTEGETIGLTINPWPVALEKSTIRPFHLLKGDNGLSVERVNEIEVGILRPTLEILTPFYRRVVRRKAFCCTSVVIVSPYSSERLGLVSDRAFGFREEDGKIITSVPVLALKGVSLWEPYKASWFLKNGVKTLICKPKYDVPLIKIVPDTVFPLKVVYEGKELKLDLLNLDDRPHLVNVVGAFRIRNAKLTYLTGEEESLLTEFDRVKFVMGRWKIVKLSLEISKLIEAYLKKKSYLMK
jgi:hypothetical protein